MQKKRMRKTISLRNAAKSCEIHLLDKKNKWKSQQSTQKALYFVINWYTENGSGVEKSSDNNIMQYIK